MSAVEKLIVYCRDEIEQLIGPFRRNGECDDAVLYRLERESLNGKQLALAVRQFRASIDDLVLAMPKDTK